MLDSDPVARSIAAFQYLAQRGGLHWCDSDAELLSKQLERGAIGWLGGIRESADGGVTFVEAVACEDLTEEQRQRFGLLVGAAYLGFYQAAGDGVALTDPTAVQEWYGASVEQNYPEAGPAFLKFATVYWTMKVLLRELDVRSETVAVADALGRIDRLLGELFFPSYGPFKADPSMREKEQRRFLRAFGRNIDVNDFLANNPILIRDRRETKRKRWLW